MTPERRRVTSASLPPALAVHGSNHGVVNVGDGNITVQVIAADTENVAGLLTQLQDLRAAVETRPDVVPLPTVVVSIATPAAGRLRVTSTWSAGALAEQPIDREIEDPFDAEFRELVSTFFRLATRRVEDDRERAALAYAAGLIGDRLAGVFTPDEVTLLRDLGIGVATVPFAIIESDDERILGLPWELVRIDGAFVVGDSRLDIARTVPGVVVDPRGAPQDPVHVHVNVCAPEGAGVAALNYEEESFRIARAIGDSSFVAFNDLGEVSDLERALAGGGTPPVIHFSGHGSPGRLLFETDTGEPDAVSVTALLSRLRAASAALPGLFYLSCCHGQSVPDAEALAGESRSSAAALHRAGFGQVIAHAGPVFDAVATDAEEAFYGSLWQGRRTREALRSARQAIRSGGFQDSAPFAWSLVVLYQRGPDHPLGIAQSAVTRFAARAPDRDEDRVLEAGGKTRVLKSGFIGRRRDLHRLRKRVRSSSRETAVTILQGLGGIGKSVLAWKMLGLYRGEGFADLAVWCGNAEHEPFAPGTADVDPGSMGSWLAGQVVQSIIGAVDRGAVALSDIGLIAATADDTHYDRLKRFLADLTRGPSTPRVVIYLDNLETLLEPIGDKDDRSVDRELAFRDASVRAVWDLLHVHVGARFRIVATSRYRPAGVKVGWIDRPPPLSDYEVVRMMHWFPALRRLSITTRQRLLGRLAGHGRSVEFLDTLVGDQIERFLADSDRPDLPAVTSPATAEREWAEIVAPCLQGLAERLSEDLLFERLWERVLTAEERVLLTRLTAIRTPLGLDFIRLLFDSDADQPRFARLRDGLSLAERVTGEGSDTFGTVIHPVVAGLVEEGAGPMWADQRRIAAARLAAGFEGLLQQSGDAGHAVLAGNYRLDAGEYEAGVGLLMSVGVWLARKGHAGMAMQIIERAVALERDGVLPETLSIEVSKILVDLWVARGDLTRSLSCAEKLLSEFELRAATDPTNADWQRDLSVSHTKVGNVQLAQGDASGALASYEASLAIAKRLAASDPTNAGWQRDLSVSHEKVGDVQLAQGDASGALASYEASLAIAKRLAASDPTNAGWKKDLDFVRARIAALSAEGAADDPAG